MLGDAVAELGIEVEGKARAHVFIVVAGVVAIQIAVVDGTARAKAEIGPVVIAEDVSGDTGRPDHADIAEARASGRVRGEADIWTGRQQDLLPFGIAGRYEPFRRCE